MNISLFNFNNTDIQYVNDHGYFNGTQLAKSTNRDIKNWLKNERTLEDIYESALDLGYTSELAYESSDFSDLDLQTKRSIVIKNNFWNLIKIKKGGDSALQGTFIHESLVLPLAQWCSSKLRIQLNKWIESNLRKPHILADRSVMNLEDNVVILMKMWSDECMTLGSYLIKEYQLLNVIDNQTYTRRLDLVRVNKRNVIVYEVKRNEITVNDIITTIATRGYIELCEKTFKKPIKLVMVSPVGITDEALRLINSMSNVSYESVKEYSRKLYVEAIDNKYKHDPRHITNIMNSKLYQPLFN